MLKFFLSSLLIISLLWSCGSKPSQDKPQDSLEVVSDEDTLETEAQEDTELYEEEEQEESSEGTTLEVINMDDDMIERSLVGKWSLDWDEEGDPYLERDFQPGLKYRAGAVGLGMTGTYRVEDGFLYVEATADEGFGLDGEKFTEKIAIVEISEEMPYLLKLRDDSGKILVYELTESYGD